MTSDPPAAGPGVEFPSIDGRRSSQRTGRGIFSSAARYVDAAAAERIERIDNWRKGYLPVIRELVELGAASAKNAGRIASDGLDAIRSRFVFERDGSATPLPEVFEAYPETRFATATVEGKAERATELVIPYRGRELSGSQLSDQLAAWVRAGTIEPSCARAVEEVIANPEWLDLGDRWFAVLGAASEMGPFPWLCRWGANILAVDIPSPEIWRRIIATAETGAGRVLIPTRETVSSPSEIGIHAGVDLVADLPEIKTWLEAAEHPFVLGDYAYSDGASFARLAVATDTLVGELLDSGKASAYAYLASPTDVFAVPTDVVQGARSKRRGVSAAATRLVTARRLFAPSYEDTIRGDDGEEWGIYDCLVPQQGANYALAKTIQRWRAVAAREAGSLVSANVAPATQTRSVTKNKVLAAAYAGAGPFGVEVFEPATSSALMAALLVHDMRTPAEHQAKDHPYKLFVQGAAHGGLWRMRYQPRSVLPLAVILGSAKKRSRR